MKINNQQNQVTFQKFKVLKGGSKFVDRATAQTYRARLKSTKKFDLVVRTEGFALKDKKNSDIYELRYWGNGDEENPNIEMGLECFETDDIKIFSIPFNRIEDALEQWQAWLKMTWAGKNNIEFFAQILAALERGQELR